MFQIICGSMRRFHMFPVPWCIGAFVIGLSAVRCIGLLVFMSIGLWISRRAGFPVVSSVCKCVFLPRCLLYALFPDVYVLVVVSLGPGFSLYASGHRVFHCKKVYRVVLCMLCWANLFC